MRKFSFQQQILTGFLITVLFISALAVIIYFSINKVYRDSYVVIQSEEIIAKTDQIIEQAVGAETGVRGFIITGESGYLKPYYQSVNTIGPAIQQLRQIVSANPVLVNRADTLAYYASLKLERMQKAIAIRDAKGFEAARVFMLDGQAAIYMDKIRASVNDIRSSEAQSLRKNKIKNSKSVNTSLMITVAGSFMVLWLVLILLYFSLRTFKQQKLIEQNISLANARLETVSEENLKKNWVLEGAVVVDAAMRGAQTLAERTECIIVEISKYINASLGVIYIADRETDSLNLQASYAYKSDTEKSLKAGEGLIGQAVIQKKGLIFNNVPGDYIKVSSALGEALPKAIFIQPIFLGDQLKAVLEFAFINEVPAETSIFFDKVAYSIAVAIQAAQARVEMQNLIEKTQQQAEELESQQEELRTTNEELIHKTHELQSSEEELRVQQEELKQINSELEEKAELLEEKNKAIEHAREAISIKALELEQTSKYKSEFLANMSHELRTPLNSILILARILRDNKNANLSEDQVKYANVIHTAGGDLLTLINDILDLSKIESGKIDLTVERVKIKEIKSDLESLFKEVANNKKIKFSYNIGDDVPECIITDRIRLEQILKNLLSNAFKFTPENGTISVDVLFASAGQQYFSNNLSGKEERAVLSFAVKDSGIGIPVSKQKAIFEAFQQADGSTSRKYGGTGLGLSISRELSYILGGEIDVKSQPDNGSTFTLFLPLAHNEECINADPDTIDVALVKNVQTVAADSTIEQVTFADNNKEHVLLIIEDDVNFAEVLKDYAVERGFKPLLAHRGDTGLEMARKNKPDAIVLDIMLPVMDGWAVIKNLKEDPDTAHIPVHLMSAGEERSFKAKQEGAIGFMKKPVNKEKLDEAFDLLIKDGELKLNKVLIIEDSQIQSENMRNQLLTKKVEVRQAFDGAQALKLLKNEGGFDCIILDLSLPDILGLDLLDKIKSERVLADIPVVINTAMELDQQSIKRVMKHTHAMVLKNNKSSDRLLDEVNLFMNKVKTSSDDRTVIQKPVHRNAAVTPTLEKGLKNKSVLIVDDDMRNIFALTSALQSYDLEVSIANNGLEALKKLDENPATNIVLMDIMMPEMDGYEAMQEIRDQSRFSRLPIIALTAKAMKNDREKCIQAGANDYISKPVDVEKLVSLMRVWVS